MGSKMMQVKGRWSQRDLPPLTSPRNAGRGKFWQVHLKQGADTPQVPELHKNMKRIPIVRHLSGCTLQVVCKKDSKEDSQ